MSNENTSNEDCGKQIHDNSEKTVISTLCRNCVFAEYKDKKQVGCYLGRLDSFAKLNVPLKLVTDNIEQESASVEEELTYISINGRACTACREKKQFDNESLEKIKLKVLEEIRVKLNVVIISNDFDKTLEAFKSWVNQTSEPDNIHVVINHNKYKPIELIKEFNNFPNLNWNVRKIVPDENGQFRDSGYCYDLICNSLNKKAFNFVCLTDDAFLAKPNTIEKLDEYINIKMNVVVSAPPFCSLAVYQHLAGYENLSIDGKVFNDIFQKINYIAEIDQSEYYVHDLEKIYD